MLEITIVFGFFVMLINFISKPYVEKIKSAPTVEDALKYRNKLKWIRWTCAICFTTLYTVGGWFLNSDTPDWFQRGGQSFISSLFIYLFTWGGFRKLRGNVSSYSKGNFLSKYNNFALYLRGFENDNYKAAPDLYVPIRNFSEYHFMEKLEKYMSTCAIGMTKEAYAPVGAHRVYVSDESWKEDVQDLMDRASVIFVLLNDRPSCIWEIEQSTGILHKVCFLVEDIEKYNSVKEKMAGKINFPDLSNMNLKAPFAIRFVDMQVRIINDSGMDKTDVVTTIAQSFKNSAEGYENLLSILLEGKSIKPDKTTSLISLIIGYLIAAVLLFGVNVNISIFLLDSFEIDNNVLKVILTALLYVMEWLLYMIIKVSWKYRKA